MMFKKALLLSLISLSLFAHGTKSAPPTPPEEADLFNKNEPAFIVNGEFLYWTVNEGALDYAIKMKRPATSLTNSYAQGDYERAEFDWEPGYRCSIGYFRAPNFWEVLGEWTYINLNGTDNATRPTSNEDRFLTGTFPQIFSNPVDRITSRIHLHYKLANLLVNRVFHPANNPHSPHGMK